MGLQVLALLWLPNNTRPVESKTGCLIASCSCDPRNTLPHPPHIAPQAAPQAAPQTAQPPAYISQYTGESCAFHLSGLPGHAHCSIPIPISTTCTSHSSCALCLLATTQNACALALFARAHCTYTARYAVSISSACTEEIVPQVAASFRSVTLIQLSHFHL